MAIIEYADAVFTRIIAFKERCLQSALRFTPEWLDPDHLSLTRIGCAFPTVIFIMNDRFLTGFIFFVGGALLDLLDGPLARLRRYETERGKFLDVFADKVLGGLTLIAIFLTEPRLLTPELFWFTLGSDLILVMLWFLGITMPHQAGFSRRLGVNIWGKWKFFLQSIGIALLIAQCVQAAAAILWASVPLAFLSIIGHLLLKNKN